MPITFWLCLACAFVGLYQLGRALLSWRGGSHVFGAGSGLLRGRSVAPWVLLASGLLIVASSIVAMVLVSKSFDIPIPEGWVDLSPGVPKSNYTAVKIDDTLAARFADTTRAAAISDEGRPSFYEARVSRQGFVASGDALEKLAHDHVGGLGKSLGAEPQVSDLEVIPFAGAHAGRYSVTLSPQGRTLKMRVYVLPGLTSRATLTYTADERDYERHLPDFERAVNATTGVADHIPPPHWLPALAIFAGGILMVLLSRRPTAPA